MSSDLWLFIAVGFAAQLVDGAIGMAYGLTASAILMATGAPPALASASVHAAEIFTSAASGLAHWRLGNIDRRLLLRLALPGVVGGGLGAYVLTSLPSKYIQPVVSVYLLVLGAMILSSAFNDQPARRRVHDSGSALGLLAGILDAVGGGGWGAMVTTTLIKRGLAPRFAIGTANAAEFFVTVVVTGTFVATVGLTFWPAILGLTIGGIVAAPFGAVAAKHLNERSLRAIVGAVVSILSIRGLLTFFLAD